MGKETKEMLKAILSNTELIMSHLKLKHPSAKEVKDASGAVVKKSPVKKAAAKK